MNNVCIYLRKSRADEELEKTLGEGETLSKHRKALLKFAKESNLNIVEIKEEIVSGDSLYFRPKMLELLEEIEHNMYSGVLVMDIDRLGRGGMKDQAIILEAFKQSDTKIITPGKTYDLNDEIDEEMTEFKTFFSRRELKMITKRMQGGRVRSVEDGNYIATNPPYGYNIAFINKSRTLIPNQDESDVIRLIFNMYVDGNGAGTIANYLNSLGYKTKFGNTFGRSSIIFMLKNPVYIGKVTWKKKLIKKSMDPNKVTDTKTRDKSEWIVVDGKHEPIIDEDTFHRAQEILSDKYHVPYQLVNGPANPLAGLVVCEVCGAKMVMRTLKGTDRLLCTKKCGNKSIRLEFVEKSILDALEKYLEKYKVSIKEVDLESNNKIHEKQLIALKKEYEILSNQKLKLFDLLEQGVYDNETFLERSSNLNERLKSTKSSIDELQKILIKKSETVVKNNIAKIEKVIDGYKLTDSVQKKNELLKSILTKVDYKKEQTQKGNEFQIKIYPKLKH